MAGEVNIDAISLQISSDSAKATESIDKLIGSLGNLKNAIGGNEVKNLERVANAFSKLASLNMSGTAADIKSVISSLSSLNGVDTKTGGLNNLVNALGRLSKSSFNASGITNFAAALKSLSGVNNLDQVTGDMTRLVNAMNRLSRTQAGMADSSATMNISFPNFAALANSSQQVSRHMLSASQAMSAFKKGSSAFDAIVKKLASGFVSLGQGIATAYSKLGQLVGSAITSGLNNLVNKVRNLTTLSGGVRNLASNFKMLLTTMIGFRGIIGLFNWGKQMIALGAEVTEVDHIVESVFGQNMVGYVDEWANNAIEKFGIAAVAAKKYAGRLSSMFQASKVGAKEAGEMGMRLTELAGDLSAFYNIDTETAYKKIQSGMAGMVRPLRDLGIDMTAASLKEYALAQGIQKSYTEMTQAEKVLLRYNYLMDATKTQQGDFARTSGSLANSMRTLKAYAQAVTTQLGVGFGAAIRHVVVWLNGLMKVVLRAAQAFAVFMQTIFGKYRGGASGIAIDSAELGDAAGYADDLGAGAEEAADGLGSAADNAEKLKKDLSVLPFDELNQLNKDQERASSSAGGAGGGGGIGGLGDFDLDDTWMTDAENMFANSKLPDAINEWAQRIKDAFKAKDWEKLGTVVAQGLNVGIMKLYNILDPKKVQPKIKAFTDAFTTTFNALVDRLNFNYMGRTIGRGINNIVYTINEAIEGINWKRLGAQLSRGVNGLVDEVEWRDVGRMFANRLNIIWQTLYGFVTTLDWRKLGQNFAKGLDSFIASIDFRSISGTITKGLEGVSTAITDFAVNFPWERNGMRLASGVNDFIKHFPEKELAAAVSNIVNGVVKGFDSILDPSTGINFGDLGQKLGSGLAKAINGIDSKKLGNMLGNIWNAAWKLLKNAVIELGDREGSGTGLGRAIQEAMSGAISKVKVEDMSVAIRTLVNKVLEDIATIFSDEQSMTKLGMDIGTLFNDFFSDKDLGKSAAAAINAVANGFLTMFKSAIKEINAADLLSNIQTFLKELDWGSVFSVVLPAIIAKAAFGIGGLSFGAIKMAIQGKLAVALMGMNPPLAGIAAAILAVAGAIGIVSATSKTEFDLASKEAQELSKQAEDAAAKVKNTAAEAEAALYGAEKEGMVKKTILQPYIDDLARIAEQGGAANEAEQKLVDEGLAAISRELPELNEFLATHSTNLGAVVDKVNAYIDSAVEMAKADVYYEKMREQIENQIDAQEALNAANEKQRENQETLNAAREQAIELAKQLNDSRAQEIDSLSNVNQKVGLAQELTSEYYSTQVDLNGETVSYGEAMKNLTGIIADCNTDAAVNNETIRTAADAAKAAGDSVSYWAESYRNITSGEGSIATATDTIAEHTDALQSDTAEIDKNKEATEGANEAANKTPGLFDLVKTALSGFASNVLLKAFPDKGDIVEKAENIPSSVAEGVANTSDEANQAVTDLVEGMGETFDTATESPSPSRLFMAKAEFIPEGIAVGITNKQETVTRSMEDLLETLANATDRMIQDLTGRFETWGSDVIVNGLQSGFQSALDNFTAADAIASALDTVGDTISEQTSQFYGYGQDIVYALQNGINSVNLTLPHIGTSWETYTYGNGGWFQLPRFWVDWYAKGGLFTKATIAGFGEDGMEAAIPLENRHTMNRIANAIVENSDGAMGMDGATITAAVTQGIIQANMAGQNEQQRPVIYAELRTESNETLARAVIDGMNQIDYRNSATPKFSY